MKPITARRKIHTWSEPYRSGALNNIRDAEEDLMKWPAWGKEIRKDLTEAIKAWEEIMRQAQMPEMEE